MATSLVEKHGNELDWARLLLPELAHAPAPGSPEEQLERDIREVFARMRGKDGRVPSRAFYEIAGDVRHPLRVLTRRLLEARRAGVPRADAEELVRKLFLYVERRFDPARARS